MKKAAPYILVALLAILALAVRTCRMSGNVDRNHGFDRRNSYLEYSKHAQCRMDCRHITQQEVQDIMQNGTVNYRKSEVEAKPCPTYALEGYTQQEHQHLRIVFAQCDYKTKVVTCIDLDQDFECHCPGDGNKHEH